jgi:hypothetical protein
VRWAHREAVAVDVRVDDEVRDFEAVAVAVRVAELVREAERVAARRERGMAYVAQHQNTLDAPRTHK